MLVLKKQTHKKAVFFFAVVCLISTLAVAFHHHDDHQHFDCPFCIVGSSLATGSIENNVSFAFYPPITCFHQPSETFHQTLSMFSTYLNRAPPSAWTV